MVERFEAQEPSEEKEDFYEEMAKLLLHEQSPKFGKLDDISTRRIRHFLETANPADKAIVERKAELKRKAALYGSRNTPRRDLQKLEEEMAKSKELREYIESSWAKDLTKNYLAWRLAERFEIGPEKFNKIRLEEREIRKLFEYTDKYPQILENTLAEATALPAEEGEEPATDLTTVYEELPILERFNRYLRDELTKVDRNQLVTAIADSQVLQEILRVLKKK